MEGLDRVEVEWLILADSAQVLSNKLYLLGGGWDVVTVNTGFPVQHACGIAVSFWVPWNFTNQKHSMEIEIQACDGATLGKLEGQFEVGRAPGIQQGQPQRSQLAFNMQLPLPAQGTYVVKARVNGREEKRVPFNVVAGPMLVVPRPQDEGPTT